MNLRPATLSLCTAALFLMLLCPALSSAFYPLADKVTQSVRVYALTPEQARDVRNVVINEGFDDSRTAKLIWSNKPGLKVFSSEPSNSKPLLTLNVEGATLYVRTTAEASSLSFNQRSYLNVETLTLPLSVQRVQGERLEAFQKNTMSDSDKSSDPMFKYQHEDPELFTPSWVPENLELAAIEIDVGPVGAGNQRLQHLTLTGLSENCTTVLSPVLTIDATLAAKLQIETLGKKVELSQLAKGTQVSIQSEPDLVMSLDWVGDIKSIDWSPLTSSSQERIKSLRPCRAASPIKPRGNSCSWDEQ